MTETPQHPADLHAAAASQPLLERRLNLARIVLLKASVQADEAGRPDIGFALMDALQECRDSALDAFYDEIGGDVGGGPIFDVTEQLDWEAHEQDRALYTLSSDADT